MIWPADINLMHLKDAKPQLIDKKNGSYLSNLTDLYTFNLWELGLSEDWFSLESKKFTVARDEIWLITSNLASFKKINK